MPELAGWVLDRDFRMAERRLEAVGHEIVHAESLAEIERLLVEEPAKALRLASAALFREGDGQYRQRASVGWGCAHIYALKDGEPPLPSAPPSAQFQVEASGANLPDDLARPILAVPIGNPRRCFAIVLYSVHEVGTDLDGEERELLGTLARDAEIALRAGRARTAVETGGAP
jgi:hypothetical protein